MVKEFNSKNKKFSDSKTPKKSQGVFDYKKYKWFYTKSEKLVYGGKSAEQNEEIVREIVKSKKNYIVMHTKIPGSPFAIIKADIEKVNEKDLEETAVWTACFSRAWRSGLKKTQVDVFLAEQIVKKNGMKSGTFGVIGKVDRRTVELKLCLCNQKKILRAVPLESCKGRKILCISPGKIPKEKFAEQVAEKLKKKKEQVLNALPTGSFKEVKA